MEAASVPVPALILGPASSLPLQAIVVLDKTKAPERRQRQGRNLAQRACKIWARMVLVMADPHGNQTAVKALPIRQNCRHPLLPMNLRSQAVSGRALDLRRNRMLVLASNNLARRRPMPINCRGPQIQQGLRRVLQLPAQRV